MKAKELIRILCDNIEGDFSNTCDNIKLGSEDKEIKKVAVTMFGTVKVIKEAKKWGADMLIVHEPLFYNHADIVENDCIVSEKMNLLEASNMTVFRYHDYAHYHMPDLIMQGCLDAFKLDGTVERTPYFGSNILHLKKDMTILEVAKTIKLTANLSHLRICGSADKKCKNIGLCFGCPSGVRELLSSNKVDLILTGETSEWKVAEYVRDADLLGHTKAMIVMGHFESEFLGMKLLADMLSENKQLETKYFDSESVYKYI